MSTVKYLYGVVLISLMCLTSAFSQIVPVSDNSQLSDTVSWFGMGAQWDPSLGNSVSGSVTSTNGVVVTPSPPQGGSLFFLPQADTVDANPACNGTFYGNFSICTDLLYNGAGAGQFTGVTGNITVSFSQPVSGAGLFIQDSSLDSDTVSIAAYDSSGNMLGSPVTATSPAFDAYFVGLMDFSPTPEIASISFGTGEGDFAVSSLYLADSAPAAESPEPGTWGLCLLALSASVVIRQRCVKPAR